VHLEQNRYSASVQGRKNQAPLVLAVETSVQIKTQVFYTAQMEISLKSEDKLCYIFP
jgi:hypothetical protein